MIQFTITLVNELGLHARASAKLVSAASRFQSRIQIRKGNQTANGKSIMAVMMLAAPCGTELELELEGPDEQAMEQALVALIRNRFGESA